MSTSATAVKTTAAAPPAKTPPAKTAPVKTAAAPPAKAAAKAPPTETAGGDPIAAGVYKWAASVGLGDGKAKDLLGAVQDIRYKRRESYTITFWLPSGEERTARARLDNGKVLLELIPFPEADDYDDYDDYDDETDIISVILNGRVVAMLDRNGMKWDTALQALIRDGEIALSAEQKKLVQMEVRLKGHPAWFELRRALSTELKTWLAAGKPILKAARAKAGEGKTSSIKADRLRWFAARLGKEIEIPSNSREASHLEKRLSAEYNNRKDDGTLPPTDPQIAYAKRLASRCNIEVPDTALATFKACSDFIAHHEKIAPPTEGQLQLARMVAGNTPLPDEVLRSSKACSNWIASHDPERAVAAPPVTPVSAG